MQAQHPTLQTLKTCPVAVSIQERSASVHEARFHVSHKPSNEPLNVLVLSTAQEPTSEVLSVLRPQP